MAAYKPFELLLLHYYNADWDLDYPDEQSLIEDFCREGASTVSAALHQVRELQAAYPAEIDLKRVLDDEMQCDFLPLDSYGEWLGRLAVQLQACLQGSAGSSTL